MSDDPIAVLLGEDVWERRHRPRWTIVAAVVAVAAAGIVVWWQLGWGGGDDGGVSVASTAAPVTAAPTTAPPEPVTLVPFQTEPQILDLPTVLPEGWRRCGPFTLCDPEDTSRSITMTDLPQAPRDAATTGVPNLVFLPTDTAQVAIVVDPWTSVAYKADGLSRQDLLAVVSSIPLASNDAIVAPDEPPLPSRPAHEDVAAMLSVDLQEVTGEFTYEIPTLGVRLFASDIASARFGSAGVLSEIRSTALRLGDPISISEARTLIVGRDLQGATARWTQRGYDWLVYLEGSVATLTDIALRLEAGIAQLP